MKNIFINGKEIPITELEEYKKALAESLAWEQYERNKYWYEPIEATFTEDEIRKMTLSKWTWREWFIATIIIISILILI